MGCKVTKEETNTTTRPEAAKNGNYAQGANNGNAGPKPAAKPDAKKDGAHAGDSFAKALTKLNASFCIVNATGGSKKYFVSLYKKDDTHIEVACVTQNGEVHSITLGETELTPKKGELATWPDYIRSLQNSMWNKKINPRENQGTVTLTFATDAKTTAINLTTHTKDPSAIHKHLLEPLCSWFGTRRDTAEEKKYIAGEQEVNTCRRKVKEIEARMQKMQQELDSILTHAKSAADDALAAKQNCDDIKKRIHNLTAPQPKLELYPAAPVRYPLHSQHAVDHIPKGNPPNRTPLGYVHQAYQAMLAPQWRSMTQRKTALQTIRENCGGAGKEHEMNPNDNQILQILERIDEWDFDVLKLQELTNGGSLVFTTYTLLYKYGLMQHYKIDEEILINFLTAVQSAYHPNPYHNSTHAADVLQCTHYIINNGNLSETIKMTPEDTLAALLSACVHDYDHPGLNNNFHIKTSAYLAILYNDRSVLENHHAAMVFDLMKSPQYNVLKGLTEEQRKDVRETMIEMILSTDMGLHGKIFNQFQKRVQESQEWTKKEDKYLALSIALKMADISNCARVPETYTRWARMLADEFYIQGDAEDRLQIQISPFMDRKKHDVDFPKGQISFMNYIVIPLYQTASQFLSEMSFTLKYIEKNVERWQPKTTPSS